MLSRFVKSTHFIFLRPRGLLSLCLRQRQAASDKGLQSRMQQSTINTIEDFTVERVGICRQPAGFNGVLSVNMSAAYYEATLPSTALLQKCHQSPPNQPHTAVDILWPFQKVCGGRKCSLLTPLSVHFELWSLEQAMWSYTQVLQVGVSVGERIAFPYYIRA